MNITVFFILFAILGIFYSIIGYKASTSIKSLDDYFLAGRKLGLFALTITLIATQLGGGVILGTSRESYNVGLYGLLYVVSITMGFIILASGIAARLRRFNVNTTAELFETRYKSIFLKKCASVFSMISLGGLLVAQVVASRNLMLSLNVYHELFFIFFWFFVIGYTMLGGLRAIVNNDIFQLSFIISVFCGIFVYELFTNSSGIINTLFYSPAQFIVPQTFDLSRVFAIILIPACYSLIEQDIAQTIFAARTPRVAVVGTFLAGLFMILFSFIPVYFGMKAQILGMVIPEGANPLIYLFDTSYSPLIVTLVVYGVFAAIISTADALLCAISSHLVQDFNLAHNSKHALDISKAVMGAVGIITLIIGHYFTNIIDVIVGSYDIPVCTLFVPLMICYFSDKLSKSGAYLSVFMGLTGFILFKVLKIYPVFSPEATSLFMSACGYILGMLYDKIKFQ